MATRRRGRPSGPARAAPFRRPPSRPAAPARRRFLRRRLADVLHGDAAFSSRAGRSRSRAGPLRRRCAAAAARVAGAPLPALRRAPLRRRPRPVAARARLAAGPPPARAGAEGVCSAAAGRFVQHATRRPISTSAPSFTRISSTPAAAMGTPWSLCPSPARTAPSPSSTASPSAFSHAARSPVLIDSPAKNFDFGIHGFTPRHVIGHRSLGFAAQPDDQ